MREELEARRRAQMMERLANAGDEDHDNVVSASTAAAAATTKSAGAAGGGGGLGGSGMPDFLEMTAPAVLPDDMRPEWLPEDSWVSDACWCAVRSVSACV